jgi:hypothetical protein
MSNQRVLRVKLTGEIALGSESVDELLAARKKLDQLRADAEELGMQQIEITDRAKTVRGSAVSALVPPAGGSDKPR